MEKTPEACIPLTKSLQTNAQVPRLVCIYPSEGPRDARDPHTHRRSFTSGRPAGSCGRAGGDVPERSAWGGGASSFPGGQAQRVASRRREQRADLLEHARVREEEPLRPVRVTGGEDARGRETSGSGGRRRRARTPTPLGPRHSRPGTHERLQCKRGTADPVVTGPHCGALAPQWGVGGAKIRGGREPSPRRWRRFWRVVVSGSSQKPAGGHRQADAELSGRPERRAGARR